MSFNIYYRAKREHPLSEQETERLDSILRDFDKQSESERHERTGKGLNWANFTVYEASRLTDGNVFAGATTLPDNKAFAMHKGAHHWVRCLNRIRREVLPDADWSVEIEEKSLLWDDKNGWHDPSSDGLAELWMACLISAPFRFFMR